MNEENSDYFGVVAFDSFLVETCRGHRQKTMTRKEGKFSKEGHWAIL